MHSSQLRTLLQAGAFLLPAEQPVDQSRRQGGGTQRASTVPHQRQGPGDLPQRIVMVRDRRIPSSVARHSTSGRPVGMVSLSTRGAGKASHFEQLEFILGLLAFLFPLVAARLEEGHQFPQENTNSR